MLLVLNKTADGVVCDVACRLYKGNLFLSDLCAVHIRLCVV